MIHSQRFMYCLRLELDISVVTTGRIGIVDGDLSIGRRDLEADTTIPEKALWLDHGIGWDPQGLGMIPNTLVRMSVYEHQDN
ncbi:uncharacterized protein EAF02_004890 [Botrytis sinoallii]|uniref:uncharacterized protein n=1 Tax=Botrytis sinoallii TaxID=1463999 RepID=UPI0019026DAE|nr:uncharacterized protein EAF02_004890 [Botrytis sinoallii]KAF7884554.1 hypothetical protein EAF02_004890 [Botrytis sinoallii]